SNLAAAAILVGLESPEGSPIDHQAAATRTARAIALSDEVDYTSRALALLLNEVVAGADADGSVGVGATKTERVALLRQSVQQAVDHFAAVPRVRAKIYLWCVSGRI